jgi:hypothetical protein
MRWVRLFQRRQAEELLDKELRFHLEKQVDDYVRAGMPVDEARRRARLEFGGVERVKDEVRDVRWKTHLDNLLRDFRYAIRNLKKDRKFAVRDLNS